MDASPITKPRASKSMQVIYPPAKDVVSYPLVREGVYGPGGPAFLAHTKQKVSNIVGLTALRLVFLMVYE